ncbi:MAG: hypothetical protein QME51_05325 [Planctomycetota bacterium]|nr:hypothetical protein [Planctomycetota bacterium]
MSINPVRSKSPAAGGEPRLYGREATADAFWRRTSNGVKTS